ncbi:MAG: LysM domain-containing protein [Verrucomicrobiota bacterium]
MNIHKIVKRLLLFMVFILPAGGVELEKSKLDALIEQQEKKLYKVKPGDTLAKISELFFGTTDHWELIWQVNRHRLNGPANLKPGMDLVIPPAQKRKP